MAKACLRIIIGFQAWYPLIFLSKQIAELCDFYVLYWSASSCILAIGLWASQNASKWKCWNFPFSGWSFDPLVPDCFLIAGHTRAHSFRSRSIFSHLLLKCYWVIRCSLSTHSLGEMPFCEMSSQITLERPPIKMKNKIWSRMFA